MAILQTRRAGALAVAIGLIPASLGLPGSGLAGPTESCLPRETIDDRTAVLSGTTADEADWVAAFGIDDRGIQLVCVGITSDGRPATRGVLGGPFGAAAEDDDVVVSVLTTGYRGGPRWHAVRGTVTAGAERLDLSIAGGEPIEAEIADTGPENGWRWYAIVVPADDGSGIPHVTAVAYDVEGEAIASGESPF